MLDALKKIDKKFLIIGGGIIGLLVLVVVFLLVASIFSGPGKNYSKVEKKMVKAAEKYIKSEDHQIPEPGTSVVVSTESLVAEGYMDELSSMIKDDCTGSVTIMNNGGLSLYLPNLQCTNYMTTHLANKIIDDSYQDDSEAENYTSGLYAVDDEYVFRGDDVNNYVEFGGVTWRILKIDENGNLRLIKNSSEKKKIQWDNKFNSDIKKSYGINFYTTSVLADTLNSDYEGFRDDNKKHLIPSDVCVGKRSENQLEVSKEIDCSEVLEDQYISTLTLSDALLPSLDENCINVNSGGCANYNYLIKDLNSAWTTNGNSDNTYEVYMVGQAMALTTKARQKYNYYWVITVSGEELYTKGSGTLSDPYKIG